MTNPVQSGDLGSSADADTHRVAETPAVDWRSSAALVRDVLAGGRVDDMDWEAVTRALSYGLIESCEQTKPCAACGTPRLDYRYWRVTGAGRLLAQAFAETGETQ